MRREIALQCRMAIKNFAASQIAGGFPRELKAIEVRMHRLLLAQVRGLNETERWTKQDSVFDVRQTLPVAQSRILLLNVGLIDPTP